MIDKAGRLLCKCGKVADVLLGGRWTCVECAGRSARVDALVRAAQRVLYGHAEGDVSAEDWEGLRVARNALGGVVFEATGRVGLA